MNRYKLAAVFTAVVGSIFAAGTSFATTVAIPADPTAGAMDDVQNKSISWITTYGVPVLFALIAVGILVRLGVRWAKKAGRSV